MAFDEYINEYGDLTAPESGFGPEPPDTSMFEGRPSIPPMSEMEPVTYQTTEALPIEPPITKQETVQDTTSDFVTPVDEKNEYGVTPWHIVRNKPEFRSLPESVKARAAFEYFDDAIAPHLKDLNEEVDYNTARSEFLNYNSQLTNEEVPTLLGDVARTLGDTFNVSRLAGTAFGILNSPIAFLWGSQAASNIDPEEFNKSSFVEQSLIRLGAGFDSAWRSATKKGDWGTMYNEYYKSVTGKTIKEDLKDTYTKMGVPDPDFLAEQTAPILDTAANIISDPVIIGGLTKTALKEASNALSKLPYLKAFLKGDYENLTQMGKEMLTADTSKELIDISKRLSKATPESILKDLDELTQADKFDEYQDGIKALEVELKKAVQSRDEYAQWWKDLNLPGDLGKYNHSKDIMKMNDEINKIERSLFSKQKDFARWDYDMRSLQLSQGTTDAIEEYNRLFDAGKTPSADLVHRMKVGIQEAITSKFAPPAQQPVEKQTVPVVAGTAKGIIEGEKEAAATKEAQTLASNRKFVPMAVPAGLEDSPVIAKLYGAMGKEEKAYQKGDILAGLEKRLIDRFAPIKEITPETYEEARKFSSYKDQAYLKYQELQRELKPVANERELFTGYVAAHRMMDRARRGIANPGGMNLKDSKEAISTIETQFAAKGGDIKDLRKAMTDFRDWTDKHILQEAYDSGVLSKASYDAIKKNNEWYATFEVLAHIPDDINKIPNLPSKEWFSAANQKIIKEMSGTEKAITDPIEATMKKFADAQALFARNKVANTFLDEAHNNIPIRKVVDSEKEFAIAQKNGENPIMRGGWDVNELDTISRFKDGKVETYTVPKEIADTLKQISPWQAPKVIQAYNTVFRAAATTLNLGFAVGNAARDAFMAFVAGPGYKTSDFFGKFQKDWVKGAYEGLKSELGKPSLMDDYVKSGGTFGYSGSEAFEGGSKNLLRVPLFKRSPGEMTVEILKSPITLMEKLNSVIEAAPRLGTFDRLMKLGYTPEDAAMAARQVTIDFNRGGTWTKVVNQFVPFLNARVQAKVTLVDAFRKDPQGTLAKTAVSTVIPASGLYAWNRLYYDKEYDMIPDHIKSDYFVFITGTTTDKKTGKEVPEYFVIAKGDAGKAAWNPIEFALDQYNNKNPRGTKEFLVNLLSDMSPIDFANKGKVDFYKTLGGLTPQIVKPLAEDWANLKFYTGKEIVPYYMDKTKPPELQYKEDTPELYKWMGRKLSISPLRIQNYAANVFASYGREGLSGEAYIEGLKGRIIKTQGNNIEDKAWTAVKGMETGYNTARSYALEAIKQGNRDDALAIMRAWNDGLVDQLDEFDNVFQPYGIEARSGLLRSYRFDSEKMKNVLKYKDKGPLSVEEKFKPKRR
jgi:hypothetical protein